MESWVVFFYIPDKRMPAFFLVFLHRLFFLPTYLLPTSLTSLCRGRGERGITGMVVSYALGIFFLFFSSFLAAQAQAQQESMKSVHALQGANDRWAIPMAIFFSKEIFFSGEED